MLSVISLFSSLSFPQLKNPHVPHFPFHVSCVLLVPSLVFFGQQSCCVGNVGPYVPQIHLKLMIP